MAPPAAAVNSTNLAVNGAPFFYQHKRQSKENINCYCKVSWRKEALLF
jgi:hypothetical protein